MNSLGTKSITYAEHKSIQINDANYVYLDAGEGDLIILLHGYPDNAYSWEHQIRYLVEQGYRVVAPFLRGYAPTSVNDNAYFDMATLAKDVATLISKLNNDQPAFLVGQDWGAAISYSILAAFPDSIKRAMILAVPHPVEIRRTLKRSPRHIIRSFHWFLFQLPWLPEQIIKRSKGGFLRYLWRLWSPNFDDAEHVEHIVQSMLQGEGVEQSLAYYRAALQKKYRDPELHEVFERLSNTISTPTRVLCGVQDMRKEMLPRQADLFSEPANYQWGLIENAGHFLHREQAAKVNQEILDWMQR